jgi:hypothetical protein
MTVKYFYKIYQNSDSADPTKIPFKLRIYYGSQEKSSKAREKFEDEIPSQLINNASNYLQSPSNFIKDLVKKNKNRMKIYYSNKSQKHDIS